MTSGIHHVTLISGNVQANVDFYVGFLGLRLVKRTGGYEDARQLHLFYGDYNAEPGSLITFLVWEGGGRGQAGAGQVSELALAIAPGSIGYWLERAIRHQVQVEGSSQEFGEPVLRLRDPDGVVIKLVGAALPALVMPESDIPSEHAIRRIHGVTLLSEVQEETVGFLRQYFGFRTGASEGTTQRMVSDIGDVLDIRDASGFWPGAPGTGTADHVAVRATDAAAVESVEQALRQRNSSLTNLHDRNYFTSLYVREPGGVLIEMASDGPGFIKDESVEALGTTLFVPPDEQDKAEDIKVMLPQFGLPGDERVVYRDLIYTHRFFTPEMPSGRTLLLMHGTGGDEADLMPLAHRADPHATLLGLRGRSVESGTQRWFRSLGPTLFDQKDIAFESGALTAFMDETRSAYGLDFEQTVAIGYSNGANFLAAAMLLQPDLLIRKAVLLRPVPVLSAVPKADLSGRQVLIIAGENDAYRSKSEELAQVLEQAGATVQFEVVSVTHELTPRDPEVIAGWLGEQQYRKLIPNLDALTRIKY
ncbi:MAG: VOC family protein [Candidatus Devosia phytovorans]|uniref:VOC family protein n=1 Tax=Candidatus Devosia phytovorans TaxID=3121372 RepID=A0AAJ5VT13_9HYPH|nr:VOC family protein [Devosia sp.]WEK03107.1 MAG: VOC family protein [Devosia sp.]